MQSSLYRSIRSMFLLSCCLVKRSFSFPYLVLSAYISHHNLQTSFWSAYTLSYTSMAKKKHTHTHTQIINNVITSPVDDGIDVRYTNGYIECGTTEAYVGGYNIIRDNTINAPVEGKGIRISSDSNIVVGNTANGALSADGINVDRGDCSVGGNRNYLADNTANDNADEGVKVEATNNNVLVRNTADGNGREGFLLEMDGGRGVGNVLAGNLGQDTNGDDDIKVDGGNGLECTANAFVGNGITGEGDDSCTLYGGDIDLSLQD
mmetsp:Transcript_2064/g.4135  ORF Transcript_2064/g.4135 Transcript_2064/m.4135 type:complete len:263 (-) Transcript_2064:2559-3347(-)